MHDLPGRHRDGLADPVGLGAGGLPTGEQPALILAPVGQATDETAARSLTHARQHLRIGWDEIRRRNGVQHLPRAERRHVLVLRADPADAGGGGFPPLLHGEEAVGVDIERERLPFGCAEAIVLRQRAPAGVFAVTAGAARRVGDMVGEGVKRLRGQGHLLAGRDHQVREPIDVGADHRARRQPAVQPAECGMELAVERLERIDWQAGPRGPGIRSLAPDGRNGCRRGKCLVGAGTAIVGARTCGRPPILPQGNNILHGRLPRLLEPAPPVGTILATRLDAGQPASGRTQTWRG